MRRWSPPFLPVLCLFTGLAAGAFLERGSRLSAQPRPDAPAPRPATPPRPVGEEAVYEQLARQYAQFEGVDRTFEMVSRAVSPAVVHIVAQKSGRIDETNRVRHFEETGSGVIVRDDRGTGLFVLTNHHVVEGAAAAKINIFLQDGRSIRPEQAWLDPKADIAVLNLNRADLPHARLGNSDDVRVGSWVLALGSPFGLTHSVSQGIISARGRHMDELQDVENQDFLQTDAAINPGNSGGPLVNMKGEVIGINNSIASNGGGNEGVGFSIPINLARWIMNQLIASGRVTRGALGIDLHPLFRPEDAIGLGLDRPKGAWVDQVHPTSPAAKGGLKGGDVIVRFQGVDILDLNHLINMVSMSGVGQPVDLIVWRDRRFVPLKITVGERERTIAMMSPEPPTIPATAQPRRGGNGLVRRPDRPADSNPYAIGLELLTLDEPATRRLGLPEGLKGAVVVRVAPESPLANQLQALDVISSVNGKVVANADEAVRALTVQDAPGPLKVGIERVVDGGIERRTVTSP